MSSVILAEMLLVSFVFAADPALLSQGDLDVTASVAPRFDWSAPDPTVARAGGGSFMLDRARLGATWTLGSPSGFAASGRVEAELGAPIEGPLTEHMLKDGWLELGYTPMIRLRLGQQEAPVSRARRADDSRRLFPDLPVIATVLPDRELGASLQGALGDHVLDYHAGIYGGEGSVPSTDGTYAFAGALAWSPLGAADPRDELPVPGSAEGFTVGWSGTFGMSGTYGARSSTWAHVIEGAAHWRYVSVQGEALWSATDLEEVEAIDHAAWGWYAQGACFLGFIPVFPEVWKHLMVIGRLETADPFIPLQITEAISDPLDPTQALMTWSVGLGAMAGPPLERGLASARGSVTWTRRRELEGLTYRNDGLIVATQFGF